MYKVLTAFSIAIAIFSSTIYFIKSPVSEPVATDIALSRKVPQVIIQVPDDLTLSQQHLMNIAFTQGKKDGHENTELVQGVILQESKAGASNSYKVSGPKGNRFYGLGQIKLGPALDVMAAFPGLWAQYKFQTHTNDELIANLILNQPFNIEITSKYLRLLKQRYKLSGTKLINAYNQGPTGVERVGGEFPYALQVQQKLDAYKGRT